MKAVIAAVILRAVASPALALALAAPLLVTGAAAGQTLPGDDSPASAPQDEGTWRPLRPGWQPPAPEPPANPKLDQCMIDYASKAGSRAGVGAASRACRDLQEVGFLDFARRAELKCILSGVAETTTDAGVGVLVRSCRRRHNPGPE